MASVTEEDTMVGSLKNSAAAVVRRMKEFTV
jgi:hypothetical protein